MGALTLLEPEIRKAVEDVAARGPSAAAAFDADGTLWSGDIGEELLRELALHRRLIHPPPGDPFGVYERLFQHEPRRAFAFCVEVMRGLSVADVERWSDELYEARFSSRVFPSMKTIVEMLRRAGVRVFLVSASSAVSVRRAASALGLDPSLVLAVEGSVDGHGLFAGAVVPPVTCSEGKMEALRGRLGSEKPAIAFGNSVFDREMLAGAERAVLVAPRTSDRPVVVLAEAQGWLIHRVDP